ncbi:hypothetical protein [Actinokineospora sp. HUAS TT18]|uniref:hypothetical protein n=1 Tax=Actinokineospora sp. HUAS TT18 TaxID=3447451 RepID=UPI003F5214F2
MSRMALVTALLAAAPLVMATPAQASESDACPVITATTTSFFTGGWGLNWRTTATLNNTCPSNPNGALVKYRWRVAGKYEPIAETCVDAATVSVPLGVRETIAANPYPSVSITHITHLTGGCPA